MNWILVILIAGAVFLSSVLLDSRTELIEQIQKKRLFEIGDKTYQCKVIPPLNVLR